jgi:CheY-like chemotaxis protein
VANSGEEALNAAETFRPDILLCDLHLQDMSGLDVARKIRSQLERKETLIALYSGLSTHDIRILERESRPAGVQLFSPKPLTEESVKRLLDGYAALQRSLALDGRESDALKTPS